MSTMLCSSLLIPLILCVLLAVSVCTDLCTHKIYNLVTVPALLLGLLTNSLRMGGHGLLFSLAGVAVASSALVLYLSLGGIGAGDVKLLWAIGALMGPNFMIWTLLGTALAGGVLALAYAAKRGALASTVQNTLLGASVLTALRTRESLKPMVGASQAGKMPYAPAIALGVIFTALLHIWGWR